MTSFDRVGTLGIPNVISGFITKRSRIKAGTSRKLCPCFNSIFVKRLIEIEVEYVRKRLQIITLTETPNSQSQKLKLWIDCKMQDTALYERFAVLCQTKMELIIAHHCRLQCHQSSVFIRFRLRRVKDVACAFFRYNFSTVSLVGLVLKNVNIRWLYFLNQITFLYF